MKSKLLVICDNFVNAIMQGFHKVMAKSDYEKEIYYRNIIIILSFVVIILQLFI